MADAFQEIFESTLDFHAPIKKKKVQAEFTPWFTPRLRKHMMNRDRLKKMATKIPELWTAYVRKRNNVTKEIRKAVEDHYKVLAEKNKRDPRKMWKTINRVLEKNVKSTILSCIENNGQMFPEVWKVAKVTPI